MRWWKGLVRLLIALVKDMAAIHCFKNDVGQLQVAGPGSRIPSETSHQMPHGCGTSARCLTIHSTIKDMTTLGKVSVVKVPCLRGMILVVNPPVFYRYFRFCIGYIVRITVNVIL